LFVVTLCLNCQKDDELIDLRQLEHSILIQSKEYVESIANSVGHSFISIQQGNHIAVIGFYLESNKITPINTSGSGTYGNDSNHNYNVSITKNINSNQLQNILNYIYNNQDTTYNLNTYNCTNFAIDIGNLAGLNLPDSYGSWLGGGGSNPGVLGQYIRDSSGSTRSNSSLKAPKSTKCNQ